MVINNVNCIARHLRLDATVPIRPLNGPIRKRERESSADGSFDGHCCCEDPDCIYCSGNDGC